MKAVTLNYLLLMCRFYGYIIRHVASHTIVARQVAYEIAKFNQQFSKPS